ncbi:MAG: ATP-binding cassette domain-containing protein [Clostridia bacterium]|nr:ATP-binding cassette domain-containing protein [Clostridia bacterium]
MDNNEKKVLLSLKDVEVKFNVRGRILTAIRRVSLDVYENESLAIVGESGSGKSVLTKTFAGMLDSNGFISNGSILLSDPELSDTVVNLKGFDKTLISNIRKSVDNYSRLEAGSATYNEMRKLKAEKEAKETLSDEDRKSYDSKITDLKFKRTEAFNLKQTLDPRQDREKLKQVSEQINIYDTEIKGLQIEIKEKIKENKANVKSDTAYQSQYNAKFGELKARYQKEISGAALSDEQKKRNEILADEVYLSVGRYPLRQRIILISKLKRAIKNAMKIGLDLSDEKTKNDLFDDIAFRVKFLDKTENKLHGTCILNLAKVKFTNDWQKIRGCRIATVFQDPMTSLNPVITIGKQIMTVIMKHQKCSLIEAKERALDIMSKVGIPEPEKRFNDYPFEYSGGMRQRIVIAIALSCQPKILICDEPTTALDVTIQAQIIRLIKDLQKQLGFTTVYITHDLGVVANVAERVAVLYGGQIVEIGTVEEIFYEPRHPYTWALISSLPQLCEKGTDLFSIPGTPPSLYNKIVGDAFAPRNKYAMAIDLVKEPPMFKISDTHYAKTWLLDPRAPKTDPPENIRNLHEKILKTYVDLGAEEARDGE